MSAKEYREYISNPKSTKKAKKQYTFEFKVQVTRIDEKKERYKIILIGRHYSKNSVNSFSFKDKLRYKTAIKNAFKLYMLQGKNRFELIPTTPFSYSLLTPTVYNKKSRDDDANFETLKILRDCLTVHKFIEDDNRKCLTMEKDIEILSNEYKIEMLLTKIANLDC